MIIILKIILIFLISQKTIVYSVFSFLDLHLLFLYLLLLPEIAWNSWKFNS